MRINPDIAEETFTMEYFAQDAKHLFSFIFLRVQRTDVSERYTRTNTRHLTNDCLKVVHLLPR